MREKKPKAKMNVLNVHENRDIFLLKNRIVEENRVHLGENDSPDFSNQDIFRLHIPRKIRKPRTYNVLIHRDGSTSCVSLGKNDLIDPLTNKEAKEIVKRNMALGLGKFQPISLKIALIIIIFSLINVILGVALLFSRGIRI